jgi:hypothetical protein
LTTVINLFAGPGAGKSTLAADIFVNMKRMGISCELVREYVKDWAWEGRSITGFDQFYVLGKQIRKESMLYGKVDFVITDCPLWNSAFYEKHYEDTRHLTDSVSAFTSYAEERGVRFDNYFLVRNTPYQEAGRYQTEEQAKQIDREMKELLEELSLPYAMLDMPNEDRAKYIIQQSNNERSD